jgi:hypothetical protein
MLGDSPTVACQEALWFKITRIQEIKNLTFGHLRELWIFVFFFVGICCCVFLENELSMLSTARETVTA